MCLKMRRWLKELNLLEKIMIYYEMWVFQCDTKQSAKVSKGKVQSWKLKKCECQNQKWKIMLICFLDIEGIIINMYVVPKQSIKCVIFKFCNVYGSLFIEKEQMFGWTSGFSPWQFAFTHISGKVTWLKNKYQFQDICHTCLIWFCVTFLCSWN